MTSQTLRDARDMKSDGTEHYRPGETGISFISKSGWMNDPNGFSIIKINSICIISIIHMTVSGDLCTGGMW